MQADKTVIFTFFKGKISPFPRPCPVYHCSLVDTFMKLEDAPEIKATSSSPTYLSGDRLHKSNEFLLFRNSFHIWSKKKAHGFFFLNLISKLLRPLLSSLPNPLHQWCPNKCAGGSWYAADSDCTGLWWDLRGWHSNKCQIIQVLLVFGPQIYMVYYGDPLI